ncbi:hypothetical protein [Polluticoccus soli]|uniref:hypothetical protein n=1 Tax=Polluticoccus soli TaxID=3034150 RepID=UPI0023E10734|nr:hypothetical protein [Flavipsychrobacter sp. JY13-12]
MRIILSILLTLLLNTGIHAQNGFLKTIRPDHAQLQYAGNVGLLSVGLGYDLVKDKLHVTLMDGFVPASIAGSNINTVALKSTYDVVHFDIARKTLSPYAGLAAHFETSGNAYYTKLPDRFLDRKYYQMSAFHMAIVAGGKFGLPLGCRKGQRLELYVETGTLDSYVYYYIMNEPLNFTDMFSMAMGISYHFGKK